MYWNDVRKFVDDSSGGVLIYVGFMIFFLFGVAGLAIDAGHWYSTQRSAQSAADSASVAASYELMWGGDGAAVQAAAEAQAEKNGFAAATVTVNNPPASGPEAGNGDAVEVIVQQQTPGFFSSVFRQGAGVNVAARSVTGRVAGSSACILLMDSTESGVFEISGGSTVSADGCGLHANSTDDRAVNATGGTVEAEYVTTSGGFKAGSEENITGETADYVPTIADPLIFLVPPAVGPCSPGHETTTKVNGGDTVTLDPGVYCGGIEGTGGSTIILRAGLYIITDGQLLSGGGGTIKVDDADYAAGGGVGFYITGMDAQVQVTGGGTVKLRAEETGPLAGVVIWVDPDPASKKDTSVFSGGSDVSYEGSLYFPDQHMKFTGGSTSDLPSFGAIIAKSLLISGGGALNMDRSLAGSGPTAAALGAQTIAILE